MGQGLWLATGLSFVRENQGRPDYINKQYFS